MASLKKNNKDLVSNEENKDSFFDKMKNDSRYSAKIQLSAWGVFLLILVAFLNIGSMGNNASSNISGNNVSNVIGGDNDLSDENTDKDDTLLLKNLNDNYNYDTVVKLKKKSINTETNEEVEVDHTVNYKGKSYNKTQEINKIDDTEELYYKVDNNYYSMIDNITSSVREEVIYDLIDNNYIEINYILELINKSSLDHITEYSSGKIEQVYHYKVLSADSSAQNNEVVEISILEENDILKINIDYSSLFKEIDNSITECKLEAVITDINKVEEFEVIVSLDDKEVKEDSLQENIDIE